MVHTAIQGAMVQAAVSEAFCQRGELNKFMHFSRTDSVFPEFPKVFLEDHFKTVFVLLSDGAEKK